MSSPIRMGFSIVQGQWGSFIWDTVRVVRVANGLPKLGFSCHGEHRSYLALVLRTKLCGLDLHPACLIASGLLSAKSRTTNSSQFFVTPSSLETKDGLELSPVLLAGERSTCRWT